MKYRFYLTLILGILMFIPAISSSQSIERSELKKKDTWNLADIYPSDDAWREAKDNVAKRIAELPKFKGTLSESADNIQECLEFQSKLTKDFYRLYSYANMKSDEDTRDSKYLAMTQEMSQLGTDFGTNTAYIDPEILAINRETLEGFLVNNSGLEPYKMYFNDLWRTQEHTLSEKEEKIIAAASLMSGSAGNIFSTFANAEFPYPELTLSNGETVTLNQSAYGLYRALPNREDRERVFDTFWGAIAKYKMTFGEAFYANLKKDMFYARTRNYNSTLESSLDRNNIPTDVYMALIDNVNNNLDSFHRYLNIKKRMLNLDTLKYSDVYAPTVKGVDINYDIEEGKKMVLKSLKPLGREYTKVVKKAFNERWIDIYPTPGKRSGAYSNGSVSDVHPYILMNYNGKYTDVSTLIHELGHSMHSYYSNKSQPYPLTHYSIFVAEVASTFNEALLLNYVLENVKDDDIKLSILMDYLDGIKGTVFRQAQFAEFELKTHLIAEKGDALTGERLTELYGSIIQKYYGQDEGVCQIKDLYNVEWAFIPHFYYNYYVYQYATSFTASTALSEKVLNKEKGAVKNYIHFLSSGGSKYPIDILKDAGIDMTGSEPFNKTMQAMNRAMDEIEKILDKKG